MLHASLYAICVKRKGHINKLRVAYANSACNTWMLQILLLRHLPITNGSRDKCLNSFTGVIGQIWGLLYIVLSQDHALPAKIRKHTIMHELSLISQFVFWLTLTRNYFYPTSVHPVYLHCQNQATETSLDTCKNVFMWPILPLARSFYSHTIFIWLPLPGWDSMELCPVPSPPAVGLNVAM